MKTKFHIILSASKNVENCPNEIMFYVAEYKIQFSWLWHVKLQWGEYKFVFSFNKFSNSCILLSFCHDFKGFKLLVTETYNSLSQVHVPCSTIDMSNFCYNVPKKKIFNFHFSLRWFFEENVWFLYCTTSVGVDKI